MQETQPEPQRGSMGKQKKIIYSFGSGKAEGKATMRDLLGGKGAGLHEMTRIGVPVPPGFTITTDVCTYYYAHHRQYPKGLESEADAALARVEKILGRRFGDAENPLLVSVRSGAKESMPGMMDTVLNLGLNDQTVQGLIHRTRNPRFAYDSYRRFVQMYADVVLGLKPKDNNENGPFAAIIDSQKKRRGVHFDSELDAEDLKEVVAAFKAEVKDRSGKNFPDDPRDQLWGAIGAVFGSWNNDRAIAYRELYHIPHHWGTAVNVQAMVFGNLGERCATGVAFTRNPSTGERQFYGEFLVNAQGEDVVAGIRTPLEIEEMSKRLPTAYAELIATQQRLEKHFRDMQDLEFTVERGHLYLLQTRTGKRTTTAAVRIANDMVDEGLIDRETAVRRVAPEQLDQLLHPVLDGTLAIAPIVTGLPASPGAASGIAVFDPDVAVERTHQGQRVILVREETTPEDFHGIVAARAVVTARGGMTSHAAVVARGMGKCAVVGCKNIEVDLEARHFRVHDRVVKEGEWITVDGATGRIFLGDLP